MLFYFCAVRPTYLTPEALEAFITAALKEDIGEGDHSSLACLAPEASNRAKLIVKSEGILAGVEMAQHIFARFDPKLEIEVHIKDGAAVKFGDIAFTVHGASRSILSTERLVLNCMQRMSGIATYTHRLTQLLEGTSTRLLDTRKTTPNFRIAEKWAVHIGGGTNHRFGLYDMVMLKDNHIDFAGGIALAVEKTRQYLQSLGKSLRIEVETRNLQEVEQALKAKADVIMLDNMSPALMRQAVQLINKQCATEASGGITEQTLREVAETGVDFISVGALTHSAKSMDMSLKAF